MSAEQWSISELARMSCVSSRTLRHYQQIGLLLPAATGANGYRFYGRAQLGRLQRILLLRQLGLSLEAIGQVLDGAADPVQALQVHHAWLLAERQRLDTMAGTVAATIDAMQNGEAMGANDMFTGFAENPYQEEAMARWGKEAVAKSNARYALLTAEQKQAMKDESAAINAELARCAAAGLGADDGAVQAAVDRHYRWVSFHWTPTAAAYAALGQMYVDDPRFAASYSSAGVPAEYVRDAMKVYAGTRLA